SGADGRAIAGQCGCHGLAKRLPMSRIDCQARRACHNAEGADAVPSNNGARPCTLIHLTSPPYAWIVRYCSYHDRHPMIHRVQMAAWDYDKLKRTTLRRIPCARIERLGLVSFRWAARA